MVVVQRRYRPITLGEKLTSKRQKNTTQIFWLLLDSTTVNQQVLKIFVQFMSNRRRY